jgi:osmotically-inducible protein OsmY
MHDPRVPQPAKEDIVKSDSQLVGDVTEELLYDPRIMDVAGVAVSAEAGNVTLRGTVGSFYQKRAAAAASRRVRGVTGVRNELQVRLMTEGRREDSDIRAAALQALILDGLVPAERIDVKVDDGLLILTGAVSWQFQRDAAELDVLPLIGIVEIDDQIVVDNEANAADVAARINDAFVRNAQLNDSAIQVSSDADAVTLSGVVRTWSEHAEALDAAWSAPGVARVRDELEVVY